MIRLIVDNKSVPISWITFTDGAITCKVSKFNTTGEPNNYASISVGPETPVKDVLFSLQLLMDALENMECPRPKHIRVSLPFLPFARADRRFEDGNPVPLRLFLKGIEALKFDEVSINDPHNEDALQGYNIPFSIRSQAQCFAETMRKIVPNDGSLVLVSPDKGAAKKIQSISDYLISIDVPHDVIQADKERNNEGRIINTTLPDCDLQGKYCIIVDDISAGGGTFIPLGHLLKDYAAKTVVLYVTHGIFDRHLGLLDPAIDLIYCHNIVGSFINQLDIANFNQRKEV